MTVRAKAATSDKAKLNRLLTLYADAKAIAADAEARMRECQTELIDEMENQGRTTVEYDGTKGALVRGVRLDIDQDKLRKSVGAKLWEKITTRVLDKKLLESAVALGDVDPVVVAQATEERAIAPYVRITESGAGGARR
jgi:uncharacterized protein YciI